MWFCQSCVDNFLVAEIQPGHFTSEATFTVTNFERDEILFEQLVIKVGRKKKYLGHFGLSKTI